MQKKLAGYRGGGGRETLPRGAGGNSGEPDLARIGVVAKSTVNLPPPLSPIHLEKLTNEEESLRVYEG